LFSQVVFPFESEIDNKAELKVYSTDKGVLIPRISDLNMIAIKKPALGLWVFNKSTDGFCFFDGTNWQAMEKTPNDSIEVPAYNGELFYSTADKKIKYWNGSAWVAVGTL